MRILAVDPGLEGAAAVLDRISGTVVMLVALTDLSIVGEAAKRRLDAVSFAQWVVRQGVSHAYVEAANAMPGQGVSSMFRYGRVAGAIEGLIATCQVPLTFVHPATWKKFLPLDSSKEDCPARAIQLLPSASGELQRAKDHHRAEAILLGFYGLDREISA